MSETNNLECSCFDCQEGRTKHQYSDVEFELSIEDEAHWHYLRETECGGDLFLDYFENNGLYAVSPPKITRLYEFGKCCEKLGDYEEIKSAMTAWNQLKGRMQRLQDAVEQAKKATPDVVVLDTEETKHVSKKRKEAKPAGWTRRIRALDS